MLERAKFGYGHKVQKLTLESIKGSGIDRGYESTGETDRGRTGVPRFRTGPFCCGTKNLFAFELTLKQYKCLYGWPSLTKTSRATVKERLCRPPQSIRTEPAAGIPAIHKPLSLKERQ